MANVQDKQLAIARVYARSMLELAGTEEARSALVEELQEVVSYAADNPDFEHFVSSPLVDSERRAESLEKLFRGKLSDLVVDAMQVINRKGRLSLLQTIAAVSRSEAQALRGRLDAHVVTAVPLSNGLQAELSAAIERWAGRPADLTAKVDPELIGGMVLRVGDRKIEQTVRQELRGLREAIADRASRQVYADFFDEGRATDG